MSESGSSKNIPYSNGICQNQEESKDMEKQPYVLTDLENLSHIQAPLKSTQRIKYTCFTVSKKFLIFGATSGGLYIFKREPCSFLQLIPSKDGALCHVAMSPDEKVIAYATTKGVVVMVEHHAQQGAGTSRRLQISNEHLGSEVTALKWSTNSDELYAGDSVGKVSVCCVSLFSAKNIFQTPSLQLMQLDSCIVQLDYQQELLLISTLTRCYLSDTTKEQYKQVGQKLRDGEYGACFLNQGEGAVETEQVESNSEPHAPSSNQFDLLAAHENLPQRVRNLRVFSARPGSRLWEVKSDGTVLSTHQFRQALASLHPTQIISNKIKQERLKSNITQDNTKHSFNFAKLYPIANKFIFTFRLNGIYIFDPDNAEVVLWNNEFNNIIDAKIVNDTIYLWLSSGEMHALGVSLIEKCIMRLYFRKHYALCAQLCSLHTNLLVQKIPTSRKLHFLIDLHDKLLDLGLSELQQKLVPLLSEISKIVPEKSKSQKLRSGIYVVGNNHVIESDEEDGRVGLRIFRSLSGNRAKKGSERSRSLSSSPDSRRRRKSGPKRQVTSDLTRQSHTGSLHSLPDIGNKSPNMSPIHKRHNEVQEKSNIVNGTKANERLEWESQYATFDDMFNVPDVTFSLLSSPETIAALKDLTQTLSVKISSSTKSLKQKWHAFGGKVRSFSQDPPPAPLDVGTQEYQEVVPVTEQQDQDLEILLPNGKPVRMNTKPEKISAEDTYPEIDLSSIQELCEQIRKDENKDENINEKIVIKMNEIYQEFVNCNDITNEPTHWLQNSIIQPFPFTHYFNNDDIQIIKNSIKSQLENSNIIKILKEWENKINYSEEYPDIFRNIYSSQELIIDTLLSRIITMYSQILDGHEILAILNQVKCTCYFMSWCAVLNNFQQDVLTFITSESRENIRKLITNQNYPLPKLLNVMYLILRVSSVEGIDICVTIGEKVSIKNFCYVVLKLQHNKLNSNTSNQYIQRYCQNIFLTYLTKLKNNNKDIDSECHSDKEIFEYTLSAYLNINIINSDEMCSCGFPKPHSMRNSPLQFEYIGNIILNYYKQNDSENYILICSKLGLWQNVLKYKLENGTKIADILSYIIQLDCAFILEQYCSQFSETLWCELLQMKRSLERSELCLNCGDSFKKSQEWCLTWTHLGYALIKSVGADTACDLLLRYIPEEKNKALDVKFYQACMFSTMVSEFGETPRQEVVKVLQKPSAEPMQLFSAEVCGTISEALSRDLVLHGGSPISVLPSGSGDHHWGVQTSLRGTQCLRCTLPLSDPVLLSQGGVRVFPCSHAYHAACLNKTNTFCKLCN